MTSQLQAEVTGNNIYLFENFLPKDLQDKLERYLSGPDMPWVLSRNLVFGTDTEKAGTVGFYHTFYADSEITSDGFDRVSWVISRLPQYTNYKINIDEIVRVRANLLPVSINQEPHDAHVDFYGDHWAAVYYVNDSEGDLLIYNEQYNEALPRPSNFTIKQRISPKKGSLVCFNGRHFHATTSPKQDIRISLAYNFTTK